MKQLYSLILVLAPLLIFSQCLEGDCEDGRGQYKFKNGVYVGDFSGGQIEGEGVFKNKKGYTYSGSWIQDKKEGFGEEFLRRGGEYVGHFFNNQRNGYGEAGFLDTKFMKNMNYKGKWSDGSMCGEGTLSYSREVKYGRKKVIEQNSLSGVFINGVFQGRLTESYADELIWKSFNLKADHFQKYQRLSEKEYKRAKSLASLDGDIFISCECSSGFLIFQTKSILRKELSWWSSIIPSKTKSIILNTMQREFDIIEWHARELKNELNKEFLSCSQESLAKAWELWAVKSKEAKQVRKAYSTETAWNPKKGIIKNKRPQEKWNGKIEAKLRKYKKANQKTLDKLKKRISKKAKKDCDSLEVNLANLPQKRDTQKTKDLVLAQLKPLTPKQLAKKLKREKLELKKNLATKLKKDILHKKTEKKKRKEKKKRLIKEKKAEEKKAEEKMKRNLKKQGMEEKKAEEKKAKQLRDKEKEEQKIEAQRKAEEKKQKALDRKARKDARKLKRSQRSFEPNFPRSKQLE